MKTSACNRSLTLAVASANAARAEAESEIARRGLTATVVSLYYSVSAFESKRKVLEEALHEAEQFTDLTQKREAVREVAHADVVKAQLQQQQRQRDLGDARRTAADRARLPNLPISLSRSPQSLFDWASDCSCTASGAGRGRPARDSQQSRTPQRARRC